MADNASFRFSFSDGTLDVNGSELFVTQQVESFREAILESLRQSVTAPVVLRGLPAPEQGADRRPDVVEDASSEAPNPYPKVLDVMNDKVKVTRTIKGSTTAEKSIRLILVYLWGKEKLLGQATADYKELRDLCEEHACLDSSNFSGTLTSKKNLVVVDGVKNSNAKICKLTYPGREKAEEYLREMNEG